MILRILPLSLRSSVIGVTLGALPGAGGDIASLIAYGHARRSVKNPTAPFGKGAYEGVVLGPLVDTSFRRALISEHSRWTEFGLSFVTNLISLIRLVGFILLLVQQSHLPAMLRQRLSRREV